MWHYTQNGQTFGPLPDAELDNLVNSGRLASDTLVWQEGMSDWQPYNSVRCLSGSSANSPKEAPKIRLQEHSETRANVPSSPAESAEKNGASAPLQLAERFARRAKIEAVSSWIAVGILLLAMIVFVGMLAGRSTRRYVSERAQVAESPIEDEPKPARKPVIKRPAKVVSKRHIEEEVLTTLATNGADRVIWIEVSPDAKHTAWLKKGEIKLSPEKQKQVDEEIDALLTGRGRGLTKTVDALSRRGKQGLITVDGEPQFPIEHSRYRAFRPDSRHFAYIVNMEEETKKQTDGTSINRRYDHFAVLDGKPVGKPYSTYVSEREGLSKLQFSADSSAWSCIALKSSKVEHYVVVINGRDEQPVMNPETEVLFSPAGSNYAYKVQLDDVGNTNIVVFNGKSLGPYRNAGGLQFSADGQHLGFFANRNEPDGEGRESLLVLDGAEKPLPKGEAAYRLSLSSNGLAVVYAVNNGSKARIYLNGQAGKRFDEINNIVLSQDGAHVAYLGRNGKQYHIVLDANIWPDYGRIISKPVFSQDSQHLACWAKAKGNQHVRVVADNNPQAEYVKEDSESVAYSPNGEHLAYVAKNSTNWVLVLDGVERPIPGGNSSHTLVFSPDGKRLAMVVKPAGNGGPFCFLDGKRQNPFEEIEAMTFTPDGRHLIYIAKAKRRGQYDPDERLPYYIVLDGDKGPELDEILPVRGRKLWFDDAGLICYVAVRDDKVISFREDPR